MNVEMDVGDQVALKAGFLRSIGDYSHAKAMLRGTIVSRELRLPKGHWIVTVQWQNGTAHTINTCNLVLKDRIHLEPN